MMPKLGLQVTVSSAIRATSFPNPPPASWLPKKIREDPGEVKEILSASLKSIHFIIKEKRETVNLIPKEWKVDPPVASASYDSILRALAENGVADPAAIERMIQDAKLLIKSTREVGVNDVIDFTLVRQTLKSLK